jgi:hypothetical protein
MSEVVVIQGRDLLEYDLLTINEYRKTELNSTRPIDPSSDKDAARDLFFLVHDNGQLVAFGRLHRLTVQPELAKFNIFGIATTIATAKGNGYGTELMKSVAQYVRDCKVTSIGFCDPKVTGFYKKCDFLILQGGIKQFSFADLEGMPLEAQHPNDDALYLDGSDHLVRMMTENTGERVKVSRPPW